MCIYVQQQITVPKTVHNVFHSTQQEAFCGQDQSMCSQKTKTDIFLSWTYWTTLDLSFTVTYKHCVPQHVRSGVVKWMHGCMGWDAAHWAEVEWGHRGRSSFLAANWKYENISLHSAFYCTGLFQVYHATLEWKHICYRQLPTLGRRATWEHLVSDVLKATLFWLNWR